jgi:transposase-like protein
MAISKETRAAIIAESSDYTYAELAERHGCSRSSVQRIVSQSNSAPAGAPQAAAGGDSGSGSQDAAVPQPYASDEHTTIQPTQDDNLEEIQVQADDALTGLLSKLNAQDGGAADAMDPSMSTQQEAHDAVLGDMSHDQAEDLARGLGIDVDEDKPAAAPKKRGAARARRVRIRAPEPAPASSRALTVPGTAAPAADEPLPLPLARTQLSLYLTSFKDDLIACGYATADELESQVQRVSRMQRAEIADILQAVKGTLTLETSVHGVKSGCLMAASIGSQFGPLVGLQLTGMDRALQEKSKELDMASRMLILEDWQSWQNQINGKSRLVMMLCQTALQVHSQNTQVMEQRKQQAASDELLRTLDGHHQ